MKPNENRKSAYIAVIITAVVLTAAMIYTPKAVIDSIPTANSVSVKKVPHQTSADVSGSIIKDYYSGEYSVQTFIGEKDISAVKIGQQAEITGDAFPDTVYTGEVLKIADNASKIQFGNALRTMVEVTVLINNPDETLKSGYTANVKIKTSDEAVLTVLPYEAVNQDNYGEFVYIIDADENTAVKRYITTGRELSDGVEILSGITPNDEIVTVEDNYTEGKKIRVNN